MGNMDSQTMIQLMKAVVTLSESNVTNISAKNKEYDTADGW